MQKSRVFPLLVCCGLLGTSAAMADESAAPKSFEAYSLGDVYVKGEKTSLTEETSVTNIIIADDIKATSSHTIAEALANVPGIRVSTSSKNIPSVSMRGLDQKKTLFLIDGVPYYNTYDGTLDLSQFNTSNVARIEITKGAPSVLYGANALAGVINVITKQPTGKPYFEVTQEFGEVDTYRTSVSHGMKKGMFSYWLNYDHEQSGGVPMSDDYELHAGKLVMGKKTTYPLLQDGGKRVNTDFSKDGGSAKFGFQPSDKQEYFVNFYYIERDKGNALSTDSVTVNQTRPAFTPLWRYPVYRDWGVDVSGMQKPLDKLTVREKFFYHDHKDVLNFYNDLGYQDLGGVSTWQEYFLGGSLIVEYQPVTWNTTRAAFNFRGDDHQEKADSYLPFADSFAFTGSAGLENETHIGDRFSVVIGGSYDWFHVTDGYQNTTNKKTGDFTGQVNNLASAKDSFNPMIGMSYLFPDSTKLFVSSAKKTRFPTLSDLFSSKRGGNPNLKPEEAINSTIGVSRPFTKYAWGQLAFFYNDITDFITSSAKLSDGTTPPKKNIGRVEIYGIELNAEAYPVDGLTLKFGYTLNEATNKTAGLDAIKNLNDARKVTGVPEHTIDVGAQYTVPYLKTRIDLNGVFMATVYSTVPTFDNPKATPKNVGDYFVLNTRFTQPISKNFETYLAINNILDRDYATETSDYPAPGRTIFGGITAKF
jgi:iron complex outermembrane recepter protein